VIRKVEVSIDAGPAPGRKLKFRGPVNSKGATRVSDLPGTGTEKKPYCNRVAPTNAVIRNPLPRSWRNSGRVEPEFFRTTGTIPGHFNAIQPWKINRDGSVQNALVL